MIVSAVFWSEFPNERIIEQTFSVSENAETASLFHLQSFSSQFSLSQLGKNEFENYKRAQNVRDIEKFIFMNEKLEKNRRQYKSLCFLHEMKNYFLFNNTWNFYSH